jgi:hypothetical protein
MPGCSARDAPPELQFLGPEILEIAPEECAGELDILGHDPEIPRSKGVSDWLMQGKA